MEIDVTHYVQAYKNDFIYTCMFPSSKVYSNKIISFPLISHNLLTDNFNITYILVFEKWSTIKYNI